MHITSRFHHSHIDKHRNLDNLLLTMLLFLLFLILMAVFLVLTAQKAEAQLGSASTNFSTGVGQNAVPPTAVQAAKMPQFASKLAGAARQAQTTQNASRVNHSARAPASYKNAAAARKANGRVSPPDNGLLYENGPINGTTDAWTINYGFVVSDAFTVQQDQSSVTGMTFGAWLFLGDTLQSSEVSITSQENGGTVYFDQVVNFTQSGCVGNQYGYNVCTEAGSFSISNLASGTYWVNLQNAIVDTGDPIYWDENSGVGCNSPGCPSQASENWDGTIPSEAFTILGETTTTTTTCDYDCGPELPCYDSGGNVEVIHDFTGEEGNFPSQLTLDNGSIYGTNRGGAYSLGLVYKLVRKAQQWLFAPLYSFTDQSNGFEPDGVTVGPDHSLYGISNGGLDQNGCGYLGSDYCGLVYKLTPPPSACDEALCSWNETVLYRFTGGSDAWQPSGKVVFDSAGNLYGAAVSGGSYGHGAIYELIPSRGSWSERLIYSFTGSLDGGGPTSLLVGNDGNLYGLAGNVVFQLVPSGGQWQANVLHTFQNSQLDGSEPQSLVQDNTGNLYGISTWYYQYNGSDRTAAVEWELSPSQGQWTFIQVRFVQTDPFWYNDSFSGLAINGGGQTYVAGNTRVYDFCDLYIHCYFYVDGPLGVTYTDVVFDAFGLAANPLGDRLYGVTGDCGEYGAGTIWQLSP